MIEDLLTLDGKKMDGLLPAIVQDARSAMALMLGHMDLVALQKTIATKKVTFLAVLKIVCGQKVGKKSIEVVLASLERAAGHLGKEIADLLFHLLILLNIKGLQCRTLSKSCKQGKEGPLPIMPSKARTPRRFQF